jgi:hypothetical protein
MFTISIEVNGREVKEGEMKEEVHEGMRELTKGQIT